MEKKISSPGIISGIVKLLLFSRGKGSVTIEAAALLPLMIGFFLLWIRFFEVISFQLELQQGMQETAVRVASSAYYLEEGMEDETWQVFLTVGLAGMTLEQVGNEYWESSIVRKGKAGMNCFLHEYREGIEMLFAYKIQLPLLPSVLALPVRQIAYQKAYDGESVYQEEDAQYVYVTEKGEAFHLQRNCSAIKRSITYCLVEELENVRNKDGSIYYPCEVCNEEKREGYYITDYGERYHATLKCPNMQRKVFLVQRDYVGTRSLCKTCGKGLI